MQPNAVNAKSQILNETRRTQVYKASHDECTDTGLVGEAHCNEQVEGSPLNSGMQSRSTETSVAAEVSRSIMTTTSSIQKRGVLRSETAAVCLMSAVIINPAVPCVFMQ